MGRPTKGQIAAVRRVLREQWDATGDKAGGLESAYAEWATGIADILIHTNALDPLVDYLAILESQLLLPQTPREDRARWARIFQAAILRG